MSNQEKRQRGRPKGPGKPLKPPGEVRENRIYIRLNKAEYQAWEEMGDEGPDQVRKFILSKKG